MLLHWGNLSLHFVEVLCSVFVIAIGSVDEAVGLIVDHSIKLIVDEINAFEYWDRVRARGR